MIQDDKTSSKWVHFQPFWFPKVSIFKPKIFVSKLRISQKILTPTHLGNATLPSNENQEASSRTEFVSRSLSAPKILPKSSQRSFPGGCCGCWWLTGDFTFPKVWWKHGFAKKIISCLVFNEVLSPIGTCMAFSWLFLPSSDKSTFWKNNNNSST